jgi:murein DD-endopeptidase MepM/ murein hydrolase activator NlpD
LLDRTDRGESRRRGTDLVRVQQARAVFKNGRVSGGQKQAPTIYLSELGPRRVVMQLKWLVSTIIVAVAGLTIIGIVIYTSINVGNGGGSMFGAMRRAGLQAMKPRGGSTPGLEKPVAIGLKTDRLVISSKGLTTRNLIYEQIVQRRGTRDFITTKPYARIVATLATERPEREVAIPAFNPNDLFGNDTPIARKDQTGGELNSDPRISVRFIDVPGGFLPREDNEELSNEDVEKLVAETDAIYAESEASLSDPGAPDLKTEKSAELVSFKPEKNTTVLYKKSDDEENDDAFDRRTITARGGEALETLIKGAGVDGVQSGLVAEAVAKITKTKKLRSGEELRIALTPSAVEEGSLDVAKVSLFYQNAHVVTIARSSEGGYVTGDKPVQQESSADESGGERASVYLSTYRAARSQELPNDFITKFLKVHSYDVDFKQRVKAGDGFELFYEIVQDDSGTEKPGELLYAAANIGGETHGYYRFRTPDGAIDYYDEKGSNSKKFLLRTPVKAARLTSGFGYRRHPLLRTLRLHSGVDWAGPVGTPIMASGNGTIEVAGREGGYGNYVRIRHANGYKTAYGHMLRFAEGVAKGVKVRQGQIIGYLGNTGLSTGPHLHYEVLVNSRFTNPLSIKIPRSRQLQGRLLTDFRKEKSRIDDLMHRAPVKTRVAPVEK